MKRKSTSKVTAKRIAGMQRKATFVGFLYFLGTLVFAALSCLTILTAKDGSFQSGVLQFYQPIIQAFKAEGGFKLSVAMMTSVIYVIMLVLLLIKVLKCFPELKILCQKNISTARARNTKRRKRSKSGNRSINAKRTAMEKIGNCFSSAFATYVLMHFFMYLLCGKASISLFGYIAVGAGLLFHFLGGILGSKVTLFYRENSGQRYFYHYGYPNAYDMSPYRNGFSVSADSRLLEKDREVGVSIFVLRNFIQLIFTFALIYAIAGMSVMTTQMAELLKLDFANLDIEALIPFVIELLLCVWVSFLTAHMTATTEFNREGMDGVKMKEYRIFSAIFFITTLGQLAWIILQNTDITMHAILAIAVSMFAFIAEVLIQPKNFVRKKHLYGGVFEDGVRLLGDDEDF